MKLKYTLVFTIISFFITIAGFAQAYSDKEIGLNVERVTTSLKKRGNTSEQIDLEISLLRRMYTKQCVAIKKNETITLNKLNSQQSTKTNTNKSVAVTDISPTEKAALKALYDSTNGANWNNKDGWNFDMPVTSWDGTNGWYGITVTNGTVTTINLSQNNLTGSIPSEIGNLPGLETLYLMYNGITGSIPTEIGKLKNLKYIYFIENQLSGTIPVEITTLPNLSGLGLDSNKLTGSIPTEIGNLLNLEYLTLGTNQLTGSIPKEVGKLSKLTSFYVLDNQLTGSIPVEVFNLSKLDALFLENNNLTGIIPPEVSKLTALQYFNLSNNKLTGSIPVQISSLYRNIKEIYFYKNQLSGSIPSQIFSLYNLSVLNLSDNQFTGVIHTDVGRLINMSLLYFDNNQLTGTIPSVLGSLRELIHLGLGNNQLTGGIPTELGKLARIQWLNLAFNQLQGHIPAEIGGMSSLRTLLLNNNQFDGLIPHEMSQLSLLGNLNFSYNKFRFIDFANDYQSYKASALWEFNYANQAKIDLKENITGNVGAAVTLTMCTDNRYTTDDTFQWYKGKFPDGVLIDGSTNRQYIISNLKLSDAGDYYCLSSHPQITNSANPDQNLILERESITLNVICNSTVDGYLQPSSFEFLVNSNVNFHLKTNSTNLTYSWTFYSSDDITILSTATTADANISYSAPGYYKTTLVVTDQNGCTTPFDIRLQAHAPNECLGAFNGSIVPPRFDLYSGFLNDNITGDIYGDSSGFFINEPSNIRFENMDFTAEIESYEWSVFNPDGSLLKTANTPNFLFTGTILGDYKITLILRHQNNDPSPWRHCSYFEMTLKARDRNTCIVPSEERFGQNYSIINTDYNNSFIVNKDAVLVLENSVWITPERFSFAWTLYNNEGTLLNSGTQPTFPILLTELKEYSVNLQIKDLLGCVTNYTKKITPSDTVNCTTGSIKVVDGNLTLYSQTTFEFETSENDLNYKWVIYNPDNTTSEYYGNKYRSVYFNNGLGDYRITLEVSNNDECITFFEKTVNVTFDCEYAKIYGDITNMNTNDPYSPLALINSPTLFRFQSYNDDLGGKTFSWELVNSLGEIIKTANAQEINATLTQLGKYTLNIKITNLEFGCVDTFTTEIQVVDACAFSDEERKGEINFVGEYSSGASFININDTKDLRHRFYDNEDETKTYNYHWKIYNPNNELINSGTQKTFPLHLTVPGFHKITVDVEDVETGCTTQTTKSINSLIQNSCTAINPNSEIVKKHFIDLIKNLVSRSALGETDEQINASLPTSEFTALVPYITNGPKDKIYNFKSTIEKNPWSDIKIITAVDFSLSPDRLSDIHVLFPYQIGYSPQFDTYESLLARIEEYTYIDISQFASPDEQLISCYVYNPTRIAAKTIIKPEDYECNSETIVQYIDFCPGEECNPITGTITVNTENPALFTTPVFTFETTATNLTYSWTVKIPESSTGYYNYATGGNPFELYLQYGPGDYKIMLEVKDANGCITKFEKIITAAFDCTTVHRDISIQNVNRHSYGFDPLVLLNTSNPFTFYPPAGEGEIIAWTMTNLNGDILSSTSNAEFIIIPTALGAYKLNFKIIDTNGCESNFINDIKVVDRCEYTNEERYGDINFVEEYSNGAAFINLNETKTLEYRFYDNENPDKYAYYWSVFDPNNTLITSVSEKTFPITLTTPGFHRVLLFIEDMETDCQRQISKSIGTIITNSCTDTNPKSQIVKGLYFDLVKNLIARSMMGETDEQINASPANAQFTALIPYITNGIKDKIYNYKSVRDDNKNEETNSLRSIDFSFSPDRVSDVRLYFKWGMYYDPQYDTYEDLLAIIENKIYFSLSQYTSPDVPLISCYVDNGGKMAGNNPVKPSLGECSKETITQYIDFCPAEECTPIVGILKSTNTTGSAGTSKIKVSPSLKK